MIRLIEPIAIKIKRKSTGDIITIACQDHVNTDGFYRERGDIDKETGKIVFIYAKDMPLFAKGDEIVTWAGIDISDNPLEIRTLRLIVPKNGKYHICEMTLMNYARLPL